MTLFNFLILQLVVIFNLYGQTLSLPKRANDAPTGRQLLERISSLNIVDREELIFNQIMGGNVPDFLRHFVEVKDSAVINGTYYSVSYFVAPDYLSIGSNDDYFLIPMTPLLAQKIADALNCSLPTKKMVDIIYNSAKLKLRPQVIAPSDVMTKAQVFCRHNDSVQSIRKPLLEKYLLGTLVGGTKKDIIISNKIYTNLKQNVPKPVVIYGWHKLNGIAIQPIYNGHGDKYADYSHGVRLVKDSVIVDGKTLSLSIVLADTVLNVLLSDEGIISKPRY